MNGRGPGGRLGGVMLGLVEGCSPDSSSCGTPALDGLFLPNRYVELIRSTNIERWQNVRMEQSQ